ncbi:hypothetical protein N8455_00800, partial [Candidatus Gracilibacteria bacterium]|nr:hypothetical protein [Candidatus Gracilibacteria bacterium]
MSLEDFTPSESPEGSAETGSNSAEVAEKLKEAIKRGAAGMKRTQKDEKKAKKYDMLLAGFLVKIIIDKKYDFILTSLFSCLDKGFSSNLVLGILSLAHEEISEKIKSLAGKEYTPYSFQYEETHEFNDSHVTPQVQARINSWVEDITDIIALEYSSIQINELKKNFIANRDTILQFTANVFKFFLHNSNITIQDSTLFSISEF